MIVDGYGEYVVGHRVGAGPLTAPHWAAYDPAFRNILHVNSPQYIVHQGRQTVNAAVGGAAAAQRLALAQTTVALDARYANIRNGLAAGFHAIFLPRTLYELIYINEIMRQERDVAYAAWLVRPIARWDQVNGLGSNHAVPAINIQAANVHLHHALNTLIIAKINELPSTQVQSLPLSRRAIDLLMEAEVALFREHVRSNGPRPNTFPCPGQVAGVSLGLRLHQAQIRAQLASIISSMRGAIAIELASAGRLLLYRASEFQLDDVSVAPNILSYNTGFWATLIYDLHFNTSSPEFMLADGTRTGRCVVVPFVDMILPSFPFYVPLGDTIDQLHGIDQQAHAWTKANQTWACAQLGCQNNVAALQAQIAGSHWVDVLYHVDDRVALNRLVQHYPRAQWHPAVSEAVYEADGLHPFAWSGSKSKSLRCSTCEAIHGDRVSSILGRWHQCTSCKSVHCNICAKWSLSRKRWGVSRTRACECGGETALVG